MAALRAATDPLTEAELPAWGDEGQRDRALAGLVADGLVAVTGSPPRYQLPT